MLHNSVVLYQRTIHIELYSVDQSVVRVVGCGVPYGTA